MNSNIATDDHPPPAPYFDITFCTIFIDTLDTANTNVHHTVTVLLKQRLDQHDQNGKFLLKGNYLYHNGVPFNNHSSCGNNRSDYRRN